MRVMDLISGHKPNFCLEIDSFTSYRLNRHRLTVGASTITTSGTTEPIPFTRNGERNLCT